MFLRHLYPLEYFKGLFLLHVSALLTQMGTAVGPLYKQLIATFTLIILILIVNMTIVLYIRTQTTWTK